MALRDQIEAARKEGYSDQDIEGHLRTALAPKIKEASSQYSPQEIRDHFISEGVKPDLAFDLTATPKERVVRAVTPAIESGANILKSAVKPLVAPARAAGQAIAAPLLKAREAISTPFVQPKPAFEAIGRRLRAGAETEIPVLKELSEAKEEAGPAAGEKVAQTVARAGFPRLATPAGVAAGALNTSLDALVPSIKTVEDAEILAAFAAGAKGAKVAGNALPGFGYDLRNAPADIGNIPNAIRRRLGIALKGDIVKEVPRGAADVTPRPAPTPSPEQIGIPGDMLPMREIPSQAALPGPSRLPVTAPQIPFEAPIPGEGFAMTRPPSFQGTVFSPKYGDVSVPTAENPAALAVARRLGLVPPGLGPVVPSVAPKAPIAEGTAPIEAKITKKLAGQIAKDPNAVLNPDNVTLLMQAVKEGKLPDQQLRRFVTRLQDKYRLEVANSGPEDPVVKALAEGLTRAGLKPVQKALPVEELPPIQQEYPESLSPEKAAKPLSEAETKGNLYLSSQEISIDPKIENVKAQADNWLEKEATSRGATNDDNFKLQFGTYVHRGLNKLQVEILKEYNKLTTDEAKATWATSAVHKQLSDAGDNLSAKLSSLREAYPNIYTAIPRTAEGEAAILKDFPEHKRVLEESRADYEAQQTAEFDKAYTDMVGGSKTPVLDDAKSFGLDPSILDTYGGELQDVSARGLFKAGGMKGDEFARSLFAAGKIPEEDIYLAIDALRHEIDTGTPLYVPQPRDFEGRRGQGGFARVGGGEAPAVPDGPELTAYKGEIKKFEKPKVSIGQRFENFFTQAVDKANPILNLEKQYGAKVPDVKNVKFLLDRHIQTSGIAEQALTDFTSKIDAQGNVVKTGEGLQPILREFDDKFGPKAIDDLRAYILAKQDIALLEQGFHGLDAKRAPFVITELEAKYGDGLMKFTKRIRDWHFRAVPQRLYDAGRLSDNQLAGLKEKGEYYMPLDRVDKAIDTTDPSGAAIFARGSPIKARKGGTGAIYDPFEKMISQVYRASELADRTALEQAIVELKNTNPSLDLITEVKTPGNDTVTVKFAGKDRYFKVPADVKGAIDNLNVAGLDMVSKILAFPATLKRSGITLDPLFAIRNISRDQLTAAMQANHGYIPGYDFAKGLFNVLAKTDLYDKFVAAGGNRAALVGMDRVNAGVTLRKLRGLRELDNVNPMSILQRVSAAGESATRQGVFARAKSRGASDLEAMYEATEATLNFGTKPAAATARALHSMIAFLRPNVLGAAKFAKTAKDHPGRTAFRGTAMITLPSMILWYLNKDDEQYKELALWRKNVFWHIKLPNGKLYPIPKPPVYGQLFGSLPERVLDFVYKQDPEAIESAFKQLLGDFAPPFMPTVIEPAVNVAANYNPFTRRPIVPKGKEQYLPEDQAGDFTSETSRAIGRRIGAAPAKIDYLIGGYLGTMGKRGTSLIDQALAKRGQPSIPKPDVPFSDLLVEREPIGSASESVNRFYERLDKLERKYASERLHNPEVDLEPEPDLEALREAKQLITELQQDNQEIRSDPRMMPEIKKMRIDQNNRSITKIAAAEVGQAEKRERKK